MTYDLDEKDNSIIYVGYGANRDPRMMLHITGEEPEILFDGKDVFIQDYELVVQTYDDIPPVRFNGAVYSDKNGMKSGWGGSLEQFLTYNIRPKTGAQVQAKLFRISRAGHERVRIWENWFKPVIVNVKSPDGQIIQANTDGLWENQSASGGGVDGLNYKTYLNERKDMWRVADSVRKKGTLECAKVNITQAEPAIGG